MLPGVKSAPVYRHGLLVLVLAAIPASAQRASQRPLETPEAKATPKKEQSKETGEKPETERTLRYRSIGPYRGGRSLAVAGIPGNLKVYFFGGTGGGVWKSTDGALSWKPLFDKQGTSSIGSIAVAESDPNMVYVGTGEACIRGNISHGDGVYKSVDGGKSWKNVGLRDTRAIGRVLIHPRNPDVVFVAALGHPFGPHTERGVFRTLDGGKTWDKVLYKDENTGAIDIAFDPNNPNILFAALWEARRTPYSLASGGPGSGLYRSTDGGASWNPLTEHGLPKGPWGRVGVAVGANSDRVYVLIEAKEGGLYRSDDGGGKWELVNGDRRFQQRAWYYMHLIADPRDANTLYVLNVDFHKSTDGGHTFNKIHVPHGDNHGLWIDPKDTERMIAANDGGATVTLDGGKHWTPQNNQPTAQFYHVITDNRFPYYVYGSQQDNTTVAISSRGESGFIDRPDWYPVGGGEAGYIAPHPADPMIVFGGEYEGQITRFDKRTWDRKAISVLPEVTDAMGAASLEHRFQWTAPIVISPNDPNVLYHGGERLFKSTDGGQHWEAVSPDLTRNEKSKQQPSGGPITIDDTGTEYYDTIFTIAESPLGKGATIWVGTDDGLIQLTRDAGKSWSNVTPKEMPEWSRISLIEASPHEAGAAYVAADRHQWDDLKPYIYRTRDYGKTWTKITANIPETTFVRAVREDPKRKGLLYAGTETGVFISYDDGAHWNSLQLNLPTTPVHDLVIHDNDLVLATHGRSFWILDDLSPLRQHSESIGSEEVHLYTPSPAWRVHGAGPRRKPEGVGENPPTGASIYINLKSPPKDDQEVVLEILDANGQRIRRLSSKEFEPLDEPLDPDDEKPKKQLELTQGLNRVVWDLRYDAAPRIPNYYLFDYQGGTAGPMALPGKYQVKLTVDGKSSTAPLELILDPRKQVAQADLQKQFDLLMGIREEITRLYKHVAQMQDLREQTTQLRRRLLENVAAKPVLTAADELDRRIDAVKDALVNEKIKANEDSLNFPPALDAKLAFLAEYVGGGTDSPPTEAALGNFDRLKRQTEEQLANWNRILSNEVVAFQKLAQEHHVGLLMIPTAEAASGGSGAR